MGEIKQKKSEGLSTDIDIEIASPKAKAVLVGLLVVVILSFTVYQVYMVRGGQSKLKTQTAIFQTVSRGVSADGFVIREEHYVSNPYSGTVVPAVSNGNKVAIGDTVARIFSSESAASAAARIDELDDTIDFYRSVSAASTGVLPADLELYKQNAVDALLALSNAVSANELSRFGALSGELRAAITKKQIAYGGSVDVSSQLTSLTAERGELEKTLQDYSAVIADAAGYYVASADGYETLAGIDGVKEFTGEDVKRLNEAKPAAVPDDTVGKLVTSFIWYLVCNVSEKEIYGIGTGDNVGVAFLNSSAGTIKMHVDAINANKQDGTVTMVLRSNLMDAAIAALRKEKVKIIAEQYDGYVVDPKAVRTVDGVTGVYVKLGNIVRFRRIDIAFSDDTMILAVCPDGENGYLKQYDEIIIEGTDLYDGKNID